MLIAEPYKSCEILDVYYFNRKFSNILKQYVTNIRVIKFIVKNAKIELHCVPSYGSFRVSVIWKIIFLVQVLNVYCISQIYSYISQHYQKYSSKKQTNKQNNKTKQNIGRFPKLHATSMVQNPAAINREVAEVWDKNTNRPKLGVKMDKKKVILENQEPSSEIVRVASPISAIPFNREGYKIIQPIRHMIARFYLFYFIIIFFFFFCLNKQIILLTLLDIPKHL